MNFVLHTIVTTSYTNKPVFRDYSIHHDTAKSGKYVLTKETLGTHFIKELAASYMWKSSTRHESTGHQDAIMSAVGGTATFVAEGEQTSPDQVFNTQLCKIIGGERTITGSLKRQSTKTTKIQGMLFIASNQEKIKIDSVSD